MSRILSTHIITAMIGSTLALNAVAATSDAETALSAQNKQTRTSFAMNIGRLHIFG